MDKELKEIFSLLDSIDKIELYTQQYSDPDTFFAANYQKKFNDKIDLLVSISEELKRKDAELKKDLRKNFKKKNP